ncbi:PucR family transcriptional regulator [Capillimicrobium parvum]|uniref:PucR family transcriptional regulator n=1 Tax=Capillimicrobium parvum TaxID=2884022 RepID=UPI00216B2C64|nr:PucR family transcriptional regulator [Capillimicrobium parvum]
MGGVDEIVGYAPDDADGRRALAVAAAVSTSATVPAGWQVVRIRDSAAPPGALAVKTDRTAEAEAPLLDLVATLFAEQLKRAGLLRAQTSALLDRLVSDPEFAARRARHDAGALGLTLADAYWPAVLRWDIAGTPAPVVDRIHREATRLVNGGLTATFVTRMVLLHPEGDPFPWFERVVGRVRGVAPASGAHAIAAEQAVALAELSSEVIKLDGLCGLGPRPETDRLVVSERQYALDRLLRRVCGTAEAQRFVEDRLGPLIAWDRQHHSDLLRVLEAALDFPRHDQAARRCYMHRNTFRHRLRLARHVLGDAPDDPDGRLAIHVALKLRGALGRRAGTPEGGA